MGMVDRSSTWSVTDAKARLGEVIDRALHDGPQTITRNGRRTAVLVSAAEWQRTAKREGTQADFLAASPLKRSGLVMQRLSDAPRDVGIP